MKIKTIDIKKYKSFIKSIYRDDPYFKNNKLGILDLVCRDTFFYKNTYQKMLAVYENENILAVAVLIRHNNAPNILSFAFFEARKNAYEHTKYLLKYAIKLARELNCKTIAIGLDGHVNYSIGFLTNNYSSYPSFGQAYNPCYYIDYFKRISADMNLTETKFISFISDYDLINKKIFLLAHKSVSRDVTFSYAKFKQSFTETMDDYTKASNEIFSDHLLIYDRELNENIELFKTMKPLLSDEFMIFAKDTSGNIVGFIFWYPDFNELVKQNKSAGVSTFLLHKVLHKIPSGIKIVEIGVTKQYQNTGLILALFHELEMALLKKRYKPKTIFSSWILDDNAKSRNMSKKILRNDYKEFSCYGINI